MTMFEAIDKASKNTDINKAVAIVQKALGQTDGGLASHFFSDISESFWGAISDFDRHNLLLRYSQLELAYLVSGE